MSEAPLILSARLGPFTASLDPEFIRRYAAATLDSAPAVRSGAIVPAVAPVTQIWEAQQAGRPAYVSGALQAAAFGGVHGEHDIVVHRPIVPGEGLRVWVEGHGARPAGRNVAVTLHYLLYDDRDELVCEQWWTTMFLGVTCDPVGEPAPDHAFPADARDRPVGTYEILIDDTMATRYAEVSGDWSAHHFDPAVAHASGFDRIFLHGLCTMALCAQGIVGLVGDGDPSRVRRVAVRFATPAYIGETLQVHLYDAGELGYAFEAEAGGAAVITHGRLELR